MLQGGAAYVPNLPAFCTSNDRYCILKQIVYDTILLDETRLRPRPSADSDCTAYTRAV